MLAVACTVGSAAPSAAQRSAAALYRDAQAAEEALQRSPAKLAKKTEWVRVAREYRRVVLEHPKSGYCDDALYFEAEIYLEIDRRFSDRTALTRALDAYLLLATGYPSSKWAKRARLTRGKIFLDRLSERERAKEELERVADGWPRSSEAAEARRLIEDMRPKPQPAAAAAAPGADEPIPDGMVGVRNIRHWSDSRQEYTRVVIDMDRDVDYRMGQLEDPDRIYFDLPGTRVTKALASKPFVVDGDFLRQIRVGQNRPDMVRVVLDFKDVSDYNVFWLPDPYRLVVDISGRPPAPPRKPETLVADASGSDPGEDPAALAPEATPSAAPDPPPAAAPDPERTADLKVAPDPRKDGYSIYQQLGLVPRRVLIDPGHGGHDPGTMKSGLREKDIVLDISRRVAKLLEKEAFEVMMTRDDDVFIPLEERTAIANSKGVDLFVSIHVNASRSARPRGAETFILNLATTPDAAEVAARENASTTRRVSELNDLLQKVMTNSKITESRELATHVQENLAADLFGSVKDPRNRGVKQAPLYVLLGAQMPAVLVEVAFLSNRKDAALLTDDDYRQKVARSIATGIRSYHETLNRTTTVAVPTPTVASNP